ncbi:MAG: IS1634 family transposase, partial [Deltaproteobacteria bacterium]|nr:IS1634 family transposase [Deltaproteobacteria bacterium]
MFVRKKRNRSGQVSVQVIDKSNGYKVVRTVGCSQDPEEIERYIHQGKAWITKQSNQYSLFPDDQSQNATINDFVSNLSNSQIITIGPELIFGYLFDKLGFNAIDDQLFRDLVIARLTYPTSKLKTVDYLYRYRGVPTNVDSIYRFLDKLHSTHKAEVEKIAYEYTKKLLGAVSIVFYDVTTLYFESEDEDDLRKIGFSKDGKFTHPQIMLGLLVGKGGYPIGYNLFEGNTFEGHTLLPTLKSIKKKYGFKNPTVIADAAMLSKKNLNNLGKAQYRFIVGARIKNESEDIQKKILKWAFKLKDGNHTILKKDDGTRLIVTYSTKRAKKDAHNRERGLKKLKKRVKTGKLTKNHINNRGYNKFLKLSGEVNITIDEKKIKADAKWDGLKGYITNTKFSAKTIVENYRELWQIEKAFRISKTDLRVRPIYHYRKKRIEAHLCIAFVAYTIYKELERR